jgi:hypothetical protein
MADRTDIDALLIGALYGELTPADEARLTAHLESHPADRTALDDMARTRVAVRESRILAFQAEPPAAVSALLLQEASRRAPRSGSSESWFQRFVRSFAAHPAMAAAATVVLVLGVAGTLYLRGVDPFAQTAPPSSPAIEQTTAATQGAAKEAARTDEKATVSLPAAPAAEPVPQAAPATAPSEASTGGAGPGAAGGAGAAAGSAGYRVGLDEGGRVNGAPAAASDGDLRQKDQASEEPSDGTVRRRAGFEVGGKADRAELAKTKVEAPAKSAAKPRGIELRRPEPTPKELKDSEDDRQSAGERAAISKFSTAAASERKRAPVADVPAGAVAPSPSPPPPPPAAATADQGVAPAQAAPPAPDAKRAAKAPGNAAGNVSNTPAAPKPATGNTSNSNAADKPDAKPADPALLAWARKQRDQVVALVSASNCDAAADAAMEIYNRAPGYFSSTILTDREIKPCLQYVNRQRARVERLRAAKNANSVDTEAPSRK